ncbi:MAG: ATP-dependent Clp protease adapter ClpS [Verrucomicrobiales bacterium]
MLSSVTVSASAPDFRCGPPPPPFGAPSGPGVMTPDLDEEEETKSKDDLDQPWQVIIHNDPVNLMSYVTVVIRKIFGYNQQTAERMMLEVHHKGRSIVWSGDKERAELFVHQLHEHQLLATMSKVDG